MLADSSRRGHCSPPCPAGGQADTDLGEVGVWVSAVLSREMKDGGGALTMSMREIFSNVSLSSLHWQQLLRVSEGFTRSQLLSWHDGEGYNEAKRESDVSQSPTCPPYPQSLLPSASQVIIRGINCGDQRSLGVPGKLCLLLALGT